MNEILNRSTQFVDVENISDENSSEEALEELINKVKSHHKLRHKRIIWMLISSLLLLVIMVILYGLYFISYHGNYVHANTNTVNKVSIKDINTVNYKVEVDGLINRRKTAKKLDATKLKSINVKHKANSIVSDPNIQISRTRPEDKVKILIQNAYRHYKNKDYEDSLSLYKKAVKIERHNIDAMLGLAASYDKLNNKYLAMRTYKDIMKIDPNNSYAIAAIYMLNGVMYKYKNNESIKYLIQKHHDKPHLYFLLGNYYGNKNQWRLAQNAYYKAWMLDKNNTDYMFNLAISLDQLGQSEEAIRFYELSLNQDNNSSEIRKRIKLLSDKIENKSHD